MRNLIFLILLSAVTLLFLPAMPALAQQRAAPAPTKREKPESMMSPQEKELKRISEVMAWAQKTRPPQKQFLLTLHDPVIKGCRQDYPRNLKLAELWDEKATQAERNSQTKNAEMYRQVAQYYQGLAQQNAEVVKSLNEGNGKNLGEAFANMKKLEEWIMQVTGKPVQRDWFLPGELAQQPPKAPATPAGAKPRANPGTVR